MSLRDRRLALGLLLAVAFVAAACATSQSQQPPAAQPPASADPAGNGGVGQVTPSSGTPSATPTASDLPGDTTPSSGVPFPGITIRIPTTLLMLPWPSPADCVSHNPATLSITTTGSGASQVWTVVDGSHSLLAYKRAVDAQSGLALARSYHKHCFVGRGNPAQYVLDYWLEPVDGAPEVPNADCIAYNPSSLTVVDLGASGWRVQSGVNYLYLLKTQANANDTVKVLKHYNRACFVGRGYTGADRQNYLTDWFTNA